MCSDNFSLILFNESIGPIESIGLRGYTDEEYKAIAAEVKADTAKKVDYTFKRQGEEIFRREMAYRLRCDQGSPSKVKVANQAALGQPAKQLL